MADRAQRGAADLADALGERVGGGEYLIAVLIEQQMVIAEVRPGNVPMKVLGLQIKREHVRQQPVERAGNVAHGVGFEVSGGFERGDPSDFSITSSHMRSPLRRGRSGTVNWRSSGAHAGRGQALALAAGWNLRTASTPSTMKI